MATRQPAYIDTFKQGALKARIRKAWKRMRSCSLCPRRCKVDRLIGQTGVCGTGRAAVVASIGPHFGEEAPLVGRRGSGTIFFSGCNLLCSFCQNFDISRGEAGDPASVAQLAAMMLALQEEGCHNINFVTPSHVVPQILAAVAVAIPRGLRIPLIYNTSGYDRVQTLELLDGVVDIYMPDFKFWDPGVAQSVCRARDYPAVARAALKEMHRQVGDLRIGSDGVAYRGLLVRHLVMPHALAGTSAVMGFIAREISPETYVNIMTQYRPCGRAYQDPLLAEMPTRADFENAFEAARAAGLTRLDQPRRGWGLF
jgi:putative pyruvate formate lyase activating enzyme